MHAPADPCEHEIGQHEDAERQMTPEPREHALALAGELRRASGGRRRRDAQRTRTTCEVGGQRHEEAGLEVRGQRGRGGVARFAGPDPARSHTAMERLAQLQPRRRRVPGVVEVEQLGARGQAPVRAPGGDQVVAVGAGPRPVKGAAAIVDGPVETRRCGSSQGPMRSRPEPPSTGVPGSDASRPARGMTLSPNRATTITTRRISAFQIFHRRASSTSASV